MILRLQVCLQRGLREAFLQGLDPFLARDVEEALKAPGKLFSEPLTDLDPSELPVPAGAWSLLTLLVALHLSPTLDERITVPVALALECMICAFDILDDIEDGDLSPTVQALGLARALTVATTLLTLPQYHLLSLARLGVPAPTVTRLLETMVQRTLNATAGQHLDLLAEQTPMAEMTREQCLTIIRAKSGSIMALAFELGVLCGGGDEHDLEGFVEIGINLGMAHQIENDLADRDNPLKSDLQRKRTLPLVLAAVEERQGSPRAKEIALATCESLSAYYHEQATELLRQRLPPGCALREFIERYMF